MRIYTKVLSGHTSGHAAAVGAVVRGQSRVDDDDRMVELATRVSPWTRNASAPQQRPALPVKDLNDWPPKLSTAERSLQRG
jgi:hypothetical protein